MALKFLSAERGKVALENAKLAVGLIRDFGIGLILALLLLWPAAINDRLSAAGFEEGSFLSMKWKKKVVEDDAALKEARAMILRQKQQLELQRQALAKLQSQAPAGASPEVTRLQEETRELAAESQAGLAALQSTISSNRSLVARASEAASDPRWVLIFGGDATPEAAEHEIGRAKGKLPDPQIMHRANSYRSISILPNRDTAYALLPTARQIQADAYAVSLGAWCPRYESRDDYLECLET